MTSQPGKKTEKRERDRLDAEKHLALHHVAWEAVQLLRAHEGVHGWIGEYVLPLAATAAAVHTRSLVHFLYATRDADIRVVLKAHGLKLATRPTDLILEDFGRRPTNWIDGLPELLESCNKQVAHLTWQRVTDRTAPTRDLRRWASSAEVSQLITQVRLAVAELHWELGDSPISISRDGNDYIVMLLDESQNVLDRNDGMSGVMSGSGTVSVEDFIERS